MALNAICASTLRCDRLFFSADRFEVNPVRRIQEDTVFWWVPKLKLKSSSHLHNIPPHITYPDYPDILSTADWKRKESSFQLIVIKTFPFWLHQSCYTSMVVCLIQRTYSHYIIHKAKPYSVTSFLPPFHPHVLKPNEDTEQSKKTASRSFPSLFVTYQFNHMFTRSERERETDSKERISLCRAMLLVILSHRQGWAGATAVCLIGCAMGVVSIIRLLCHPAANPASSAPADLISNFNRENSHSDEQQKTPWAAVITDWEYIP